METFTHGHPRFDLEVYKLQSNTDTGHQVSLETTNME